MININELTEIGLNDSIEKPDSQPNSSVQSKNTPSHIFARTSATHSEFYDSGIDHRMNIFRTMSGFDIDDFMQNRNSEVIHTNLHGVNKIEISTDGNYAFFGGQGLNVLDMTNGEYKMVRKDKEKSNFIINFF